MSDSNDSVEDATETTQKGINKTKKGVEEGEPDAIASAD